jgi:hypothetical protein
MKRLKKIQEDCLTLEASNDLIVKWYVVKYVVPHMWYVVKYIKHLKINYRHIHKMYDSYLADATLRWDKNE